MKMLLDLAPNEMVRTHLKEWDVPGGVPDEMFQLRTGDKIHLGPFGHLVRELHFNASENGLHDYLWLPELVEDVCKAYQKKYGHNLKPHYLSVLHPCIVWFEADIVYEKGVLETALSYAYTSVRDLPPDGNATFGIDCDGKSVSEVGHCQNRVSAARADVIPKKRVCDSARLFIAVNPVLRSLKP